MEKIKYNDGDKSFFENIKDKVILGLTEFLGIINPRGPVGKIAIKGIKKQLLYEELAEQYYQHFECFFNNAKKWKIECENEEEGKKMYENIYKGFLKIKKDIEEISSHQENINNPLQYLYYRSQQLQEEYNQLISKYGGAYEKEENYTGWSLFFEKMAKGLRSGRKYHAKKNPSEKE